MKAFYFKDNEEATLRVEGWKRTIKKFEKEWYKLNDEYIDNDKDFGKFYGELAKRTGTKIEIINIKFTI